MKCHEIISKGMILRIVLTLFTFLWMYLQHPTHLYLILPIALILLDVSDGLFSMIQAKKNCFTVFEYQLTDKVVDSMSYLLFLFLKMDYVTLFFVGYRMLGVFLFYVFRDSSWLILFFDFVKEHMLYMYFFGKKYTFLVGFILLKIWFEYYFHTVVNVNHY
jgi:hypothetical protein